MVLHRIRQITSDVTSDVFAYLYSKYYLRYLEWFRPSKLDGKIEDILKAMSECDDCTNPKEVPPNDSMAEHTCDKHMEQIKSGELGDLL